LLQVLQRGDSVWQAALDGQSPPVHGQGFTNYFPGINPGWSILNISVFFIIKTCIKAAIKRQKNKRGRQGEFPPEVMKVIPGGSNYCPDNGLT